MLIKSCDNHLIIKQTHVEGFPTSVCPIFLFRLTKNKNPCISWKKKSDRMWIKIFNTSDQVSTINKKYMQAMNLDITSPTSNYIFTVKQNPAKNKTKVWPQGHNHTHKLTFELSLTLPLYFPLVWIRLRLKVSLFKSYDPISTEHFPSLYFFTFYF